MLLMLATSFHSSSMLWVHHPPYFLSVNTWTICPVQGDEKEESVNMETEWHRMEVEGRDMKIKKQRLTEWSVGGWIRPDLAMFFLLVFSDLIMAVFSPCFEWEMFFYTWIIFPHFTSASSFLSYLYIWFHGMFHAAFIFNVIQESGRFSQNML